MVAESAGPLRVVEETPAYWRVIFDYPPFNVVDATMFQGLQDLLARIDVSPNLRVIVFESANCEFYLSHFDLTGKTGNITTAVGPSGLPILIDTFVRLTKSPVVSIAKIRGCVRGVSSEFVLACDMRFASRENTRLGQPEVGGEGISAAAVRNVFHVSSVAVGRSKSFSARTISVATPRNDTDTSTGYFQMPNRTASLARSRAGSPPSACYRRREESRQPSLVAVRRPAPRRPQFLSDRADVARSPAASPGSLEARTPTRQRLRNWLARGPRHAA